MKRNLFTLIAILAALFVHAQTWTTLTTNSTSNLKGIHFPTASTGYAVGDNGKILKTMNGGTSWASLTSSFPGFWFWDVHFVNADTGYVVGETDPGSNPCGLGIVIKTTDGGANWNTLISGLSSPPRDLFVLNKDTVFICGGAEQTYSRIARSFDGGATWAQIGTPELDAIVGGMYFLNAHVGFVGQYIFTYLASYLSTTDGSTFSNYLIPSSGGYWNFASDFPDASNGYFTRSTYVGSDPVYLRKTTDGGANWTENIIPSFTGSIYGLDFVDASIGYIVGSSGVIRKTIDGGSTWSAQTSPTTQELRSVCFVNSGLGFAAGANGTILKYIVITGLNEISTAEETAFIYPNPTNGLFQIGNLGTPNKMEIFNMNGQLVLSEKDVTAGTAFDISSFPPALYTVVLSGEKGIVPCKILKQ